MDGFGWVLGKNKNSMFLGIMCGENWSFCLVKTHLLGYEKNGFGCWVEKKLKTKQIVRNQIADQKKCFRKKNSENVFDFLHGRTHPPGLSGELRRFA